MRNKPVLEHADARRIMDAAIAEALAQSPESSIAIVDDAGIPILLERLDGARLHTPDAAILKARTAAITRTPTEDLQTSVRENPAQLAFPGRLPITGGIPIEHAGTVIGAIGVSGGKPLQDVSVCHAGLAALT